ncbi:MAG TPA: prepilin-type N-terminal cleavage/methylation domain-containing protein [Chthoniobacterales bacterium]|jgi:prepilin-type N-terminal cleavage/methylation domain-containing protein
MGEFANQHRTGGPIKNCQFQAGFTLVELLAVVAILLLMLGMTLPAINDVLGSKGRKGAVNILLNTFEQARVAALEQSTNVYVGFADGKIPMRSRGEQNEGFPYTRFIVFREYNPSLDPASANPPKYVALTKWLALPKGISFKSGAGTVASDASGGTVALTSSDKFPSITAEYAMPVVQFTNTGMIQMPSANLRLFLYEGFWSGSSDVFTRANNGNLFEKITFARFTGRAQVEITST